MKTFLLVVATILLANVTFCQSTFKNIETTWLNDNPNDPLPLKEPGAKYYTITLTADPHGVLTYPLKSDLVTSFDTVKAIGELLKYKGDTRICGTPVREYCLICSSIYMGGKYYYLLQLQALYLINHLVFDTASTHAPIPVLHDKRTGQDITVDEEGITRLYDAYIEWYEKVRHIAMAEIRKLGETPYKEAEVYWTR